MRVAIIGSTGMAGTMITHYLKRQGTMEVFEISRTEGYKVDVLSIEEVYTTLNKIKPNVVINCVGVLIKESQDNPDNAEYVNSTFPYILADICDILQAKLIHISTDCVFNGVSGPYTETDTPTETSHYGRTKAKGEVKRYPHLTLRTSIIGPDPDSNGSGLFNWIMKSRDTIQGYTNHFWSGITTLELAKQINTIINTKLELSGLYHLTTDIPVTKYELLCIIDKHFGTNLIIEQCIKDWCNKVLINNRKEEYNPNIPLMEQQIIELSEYL
jgi:dTDP-4-dehydrorhamnose reductase